MKGQPASNSVSFTTIGTPENGPSRGVGRSSNGPHAIAFAGTTLHLGGDGYETRIAGLRSSLGEGAFGTAWTEGRAMNEAEALEYAFTVPLT